MSAAPGKSMLSDQALAAQLANGDAAAFRTLAERHGPRLAAFAGKVLRDQALAEDMVQEAFVKLWQQPSRYDPAKAAFGTWMHKVVLNRCLDETRRKRPQALPEGFDAVDDAPGAFEQLSEDSRDTAVQAAINQLPDRQRAALLLCHMKGATNQEAADAMDMNIKALESLLGRARKALKALLAPHKDDLL